jgi:plastocyanin
MVRRTKAAIALAAVTVVAAAGVAGCGSSDDNSGEAATTTAAPATTSAPSTATAPATTSGGAAAAGGGTVQVEADPNGQLAFVQKTLTAKAGEDTFVLTNDASVPHNLDIEGNGVAAGPTDTISGGQTAQLKVNLKPGTYTFFCAVPGHRQAGMEGTLTVK